MNNTIRHPQESWPDSVAKRLVEEKNKEIENLKTLLGQVVAICDKKFGIGDNLRKEIVEVLEGK